MIIRDEHINGRRRVKLHGESLADVAQFLASTPRKWKDSTAEKSDYIHMSESWCLGHSYADVQRFAREGWQDGLRDIGATLNIATPMHDKADTWRYDVAGERPDIGRFLSGDPSNMMRHGHPKGRKPVITVFVNNWISCGINAKQLMNYGAAIVQIIDQLEQNSHRVELIVGSIAPHVSVRDVTMSATWTVKEADAHIDLAAVAFSVAHPGASRKFAWAMWERSDAPYDSGYGSGVGSKPTVDDLIDPATSVLFLRGLRADTSACRTLPEAVKYAANQFNVAAGETLVEVED